MIRLHVTWLSFVRRFYIFLLCLFLGLIEDKLFKDVSSGLSETHPMCMYVVPIE